MQPRARVQGAGEEETRDHGQLRLLCRVVAQEAVNGALPRRDSAKQPARVVPRHHLQAVKATKNVQCGSYRIAQSPTHPELVTLSWVGSRPIKFLATGCSTNLTSVPRKEKNGSRTNAPCPQLVHDYHTGMGGVDVHDQIRLQRYSLEKCLCTASKQDAVRGSCRHGSDEWLHRAQVHHAVQGEKVPTHGEYLRMLHGELLGLGVRDFECNMNAEGLVTMPAATGRHTLINTDEYYTTDTQHKRRQHSCKVCSAYNSVKKQARTKVREDRSRDAEDAGLELDDEDDENDVTLKKSPETSFCYPSCSDHHSGTFCSATASVVPARATRSRAARCGMRCGRMAMRSRRRCVRTSAFRSVSAMMTMSE